MEAKEWRTRNKKEERHRMNSDQTRRREEKNKEPKAKEEMTDRSRKLELLKKAHGETKGRGLETRRDETQHHDMRTHSEAFFFLLNIQTKMQSQPKPGLGPWHSVALRDLHGGTDLSGGQSNQRRRKGRLRTILKKAR